MKHKQYAILALALSAALFCAVPAAATDVESPAISYGEGAGAQGPYIVGEPVLTLLEPEYLDELTGEDPYASYVVDGNRVVFTGDGSLLLKGEGTRQIVVPPGVSASLMLHGLTLDAGDRPAIVVEAGAELLIAGQGENILRTSGREPVILIAPDALVTSQIGGGNTLILSDAGHGWQDGRFTANSDGVRYVEESTGELTAWTPQPANAGQVDSAYWRAVLTQYGRESLALDLYNHTELSAGGMQRLIGYARETGSPVEVTAHTYYESVVLTQMTFSVWPDAEAVAFDLRAQYHTAETVAVQEALEARFPQRTLKVMRLVQEGELPVSVELLLQQHAPLIEEIETACVYAYDPGDGSLIRLPAANPHHDEWTGTGIRFTTRTGGYLVVSDEPLSILPQ